jgi:DNA-binding response OmpR family regulator
VSRLKGPVVSAWGVADNCPMDTTTTTAAATILVVEDAREVLSVLERTLVDSGFQVLTATDGESGLQLALDRSPDLVILDIGLPKLDGFDVARELRSRAFTNPVLMLTARGAISDKVEGFDAGADDYLAKPFSYDELIARVRALLRRSSIRADQTMIRVADLAIDPFTRDVRRGAREISLTQKEYALLEFLARHAGMPVTRDQISQQVWKQDFDPTTNIVDVYINYLRKKVDQDGERPLVHTVRGVGYVLKAD